MPAHSVTQLDSKDWKIEFTIEEVSAGTEKKNGKRNS
jgi:hypothetical protein